MLACNTSPTTTLNKLCIIAKHAAFAPGCLVRARFVHVAVGDQMEICIALYT